MRAHSQYAIRKRYRIIGAAKASRMDGIVTGWAVQCCCGCESQRARERCWRIAVDETAVGCAERWVRRIDKPACVVCSDRERGFVHVDSKGFCCHRGCATDDERF